MSEIDAAELARMKAQTIDAREKCGWHVNVAPDAILALIDALEKAWADLGTERVSEIDAAEWRKYAAKRGLSPVDALAALDALEKARADLASARALLEYLRKHSFLQQRPGIVKLIAAKLDSKS